MGKRKGMIREGVALALSLALFSSGMNLSGMSVLAADMGQDDAFNPTVTSEGVAGWNNSNDEQNVTGFDQKPVFSTGGNTVASDNDSDKAPWNQIDEPKDEEAAEDLKDVEEVNGNAEDKEVSDDANAGIAILSVVDDILDANTLEQRISKDVIKQLQAGIIDVTVNLTIEELGKLDLSKVYQTVLRDCPFDIYWNDVNKGLGLNTEHIAEGIVGFEFHIADDYKDSQNPNQISKDSIEKAKVAKENANKIVQLHESKSVQDMLKAYQEEICNLTSYNHEQNENDGTKPVDLNAWQPLYVFDNDNTNQVVCEGYSKAFQYLCDSSNLPSNTKCYTVTGTMSGGTGAGGHMWNIVVIDGKSYLVDVTNSDTGSAGDPKYNNGSTPLFLATPTSGSVEEGYTFKLPNGKTIFYKYDDDTLKLYGKDSSILKLSNTPPTTKPEPPKPDPTPTPDPDPSPDKDPDWNGKPLPDEDLNPDWMNPGSNPNPDTDMDPNWTDENLTPSGSGSVSSDRNNSGSSSTDDANSGAVNGDVNTGVNNGNNTGNTNNNVSSNGTGTSSSTQASNASPKTGDYNAIMFYMVLMLLALGTVGSIYVVRQKRN